MVTVVAITRVVIYDDNIDGNTIKNPDNDNYKHFGHSVFFNE